LKIIYAQVGHSGFYVFVPEESLDALDGDTGRLAVKRSKRPPEGVEVTVQSDPLTDSFDNPK
jgi:hypothetical protein